MLIRTASSVARGTLVSQAFGSWPDANDVLDKARSMEAADPSLARTLDASMLGGHSSSTASLQQSTRARSPERSRASSTTPGGAPRSPSRQGSLPSMLSSKPPRAKEGTAAKRQRGGPAAAARARAASAEPSFNLKLRQTRLPPASGAS